MVGMYIYICLIIICVDIFIIINLLVSNVLGILNVLWVISNFSQLGRLEPLGKVRSGEVR
jgi:hypothetical protein